MKNISKNNKISLGVKNISKNNKISLGVKNMEKKIETRDLVYMALLVAFSFIGSNIKILGSIALDSLPGYFAALFINPLAGAIVGMLGHFITALNSGFPFPFPVHLVVMMAMGLSTYMVGYLYRKVNGIIAMLAGIIINGPLALGILIPVTNFLGMEPSGQAFFLALIVPLTIASAVNVILAYLVYKLIASRI